MTTHNTHTNPGSVYSFSLVFICAVLSLVASFVLSMEAIHLAQNPNQVLHCDVNAMVSCGTVAKHPTAEIAGFPNSFIGMMAEPVFITLAVLILAGVKMPRWVMYGAGIGATLALAFAGWMFYTSYYVIGAVCPWCLVVTFSTVVMWFALMRFNIIHQHTFIGGRVRDWLRHAVKKDYDQLAMATVLAVMTAMLLVKYL